MTDFSGQSQGGDSQDDPIQEMIRQAIAASRSQPGGTSGSTASPNNDRPDPQSFGERIGRKQNAAPPQPAAPQQEPTRVVVQPSQKSTSPGATGVLLPAARDTSAKFDVAQPPSIASVVPQSAPPAVLTAGLDRKPVPTAPVGSNNPNLTTALAEQQKFATPLDRNATDTSGKKIYRSGWGQRLVGTLANFASGFGGLGPVEYVGPGATNRRYQIDDDTRKANLEKANLNVAGQEKLDTTNLNLEKLAQRQAYESQLGDYREKLGSSAEANASTRNELAQTQEQLNQAKANAQDNKPTSDTRAADADKYGLKGDARRDYILTGKLPKDMMGSQRQPTELETWMQAFQRDNKRQPTADEIAQRKAKTRGSPQEFANVEAKKQQALSAAEGGYRKALSRALTDDDKKDALDDLNEAKTRAQSAYEQEIRSLGGDAGAGPTPTAAASPAPTSLKPGKTPPKPTTPPPAGKVWVYDKRTGTRGAIPSGQLGIATKGANAQYGVW